ncbi:toxin-antitoxin system HicB family antitoxin [bacterium]|nr:toxin-antitoxin system HicB family antitoxin [bacterium]
MSVFSGKFVLRIPAHLHKELKVNAEQHGVSLNTWILNQLERPITSSDTFFLNLLPALNENFAHDLMGVVLFGSVVRGDHHASSDVDILIVLKPSKSIDRHLYRLWDEKIANSVPQKLEPQFVNLPPSAAIASSLWLEVAMEGKILYDKDGSVAKHLSSLREQIATGSYQRKISHGHPYWVNMRGGHAK